VKTNCPICGVEHDDRYSPESNWCRTCAEQIIENQTEDDIELGQIFG
jgi:hypothetical protein